MRKEVNKMIFTTGDMRIFPKMQEVTESSKQVKLSRSKMKSRLLHLKELLMKQERLKWEIISLKRQIQKDRKRVIRESAILEKTLLDISEILYSVREEFSPAEVLFQTRLQKSEELLSSTKVEIANMDRNSELALTPEEQELIT
jgi:hypothetical protein